MLNWKCSLIGALSALLIAATAFAQAPADKVDGLKFEVIAGGGIALIQMAVPDAFNQGGAPDTHGITEATSGTIRRDLSISGYFNLIDKAAFLVNPATEGMDPKYTDWFNIGTQGLVKSGYKIVGNKVVIDLRLFSVDGGKQIRFPAPYDKPQTIPLKASKIRYYTHGFVNLVMMHFTKQQGFFQSKILYVKRIKKGKELFMVSPDGLDETQLTRTGGTNILPSMGGGKIYFTSFRNGGPHLFQLSGGKAKPFAAYKGINSGAILSPDGTKVAATLSKSGNPEIFLLNPSDGRVIKRLTNSWGIDTSATWSPDGSQIAFVSDRHGSPQIWLMSATGGNQRRLTFQGDYNQTPDWSPRGDKIVFTARDERNVFDIFTINVGTGQMERITQNQGQNEEPSWSPDGRYIVFTSTRSGESKLYIATEDGRTQTQISSGRGSYLTPFWVR